MTDPPAPNFTVRFDHHHHSGAEDAILASLARLERQMSEFSDYLAQFRAEVEALFARDDEDIAELRRLLEAAQITDEQRAEAEALLESIRNRHIDPNFPPPPDDTGGAGEGGGTEPTEPPPAA